MMRGEVGGIGRGGEAGRGGGVDGPPGGFHPGRAVKPIADRAAPPKPIAAFLVPDAPAALAALSKAGVPNFRTPEACADAIAAALKRRAPRPMDAPSRPAGLGDGTWLRELEASAVLDRLGIACAPARPH